jgi:hypothetical protein
MDFIFWVATSSESSSLGVVFMIGSVKTMLIQEDGYPDRRQKVDSRFRGNDKVFFHN